MHLRKGSFTFEDRLRKLSLFSLEKRQLQEELINVCKPLKGECQENGARHFWASNRARDNGQKLMHRKFQLNTSNNFTVGVTEHWNRLPSEVVESPSPEILYSCLDTIHSNML